MAFDPKTAFEIATTALSAMASLRSLLSGDIDNATLLVRLRRDIAGATGKVIAHINAVRFDELEGRITGIMLTLEAFDPTPLDGGAPPASEEERLRQIIDDGAGILGELGAMIRNRDELDAIFGATSLLAWIVALRAAAMVERETVYDIPEIADISRMLEVAEDLLALLRSKSDSRFGPLRVGPRAEPGFAFVGYDLGGHFVRLMEIPIDPSGVPLIRFPEVLAQQRANRMLEEFQAIPGVLAIQAFDLD